MKVLAFVYNKYFLYTALLLLVALYLFGLQGRMPDIDDGWIGELVYWKVQDGQVRSELMRGITLPRK